MIDNDPLRRPARLALHQELESGPPNMAVLMSIKAQSGRRSILVTHSGKRAMQRVLAEPTSERIEHTPWPQNRGEAAGAT
jgi:hypothetical protein